MCAYSYILSALQMHMIVHIRLYAPYMHIMVQVRSTYTLIRSVDAHHSTYTLHIHIYYHEQEACARIGLGLRFGRRMTSAYNDDRKCVFCALSRDLERQQGYLSA